MDFKNKNRDDISRLVSDRQAYISSLELKLEKFTQNTTSYLDVKEKVDRLANNLTAAEEKIQGLSWLVKTQNENHSQQIKLLTSRYEEMQTTLMTSGLLNFSSLSQFNQTSHRAAHPSSSQANAINSQIIKDLQNFITSSSDQLQSDLDQRIELINSKQLLFIKSIESKIEHILNLEPKLKENSDMQLSRLIEKSSDLQQDFLSKLESMTSLQSERYKELSAKINASGQVYLSEEISLVKQKVAKIEETYRNWQENEMKREFEVKEASQAAWNVENQFKLIEKQVNSINLKIASSSDHGEMKESDNKINYLAGSLKKYVSLQKVLHGKVETLEENLLALQQRSKRRPSKTPDSDRSTSSVANKKQTPKNKAKSSSRSRIDVLYNELTKMVRE